MRQAWAGADEDQKGLKQPFNVLWWRRKTGDLEFQESLHEMNLAQGRKMDGRNRPGDKDLCDKAVQGSI